MPPVHQPSFPPLGTHGDQFRRILVHHVPLALASALVLAVFMGLPLFDAHAYPHADIVSETFPQEQREREMAGHDRGQVEGTDHEGDDNGRMRHGSDHSGQMGHDGRQRRVAQRTEEVTRMGVGTGVGNHGGDVGVTEDSAGVSLSRTMQQFTVATGYVGLGLLAVTLLLGPVNLVLRRRNPVSTYLRRDVGIWTAIVSVVHVICAVLIHVSHGRGVVSSFVHFFVAEDGRLLTNSFGWGNWTGLAATVIALVLLATSSDAALRKLKATSWKWLQRLNYALIALVVLHAFFYGALLRLTSPFTLLLILSVTVVLLGQATGMWLWRRKYARIAGCVALIGSIVGVASASAQGHGPVRHGLVGEERRLTYDPSSEATFTGTVVNIRGGGPGRLEWLMRVHTFGLGHKGADEKQLLLKTDTDTLRIHLGPTTFLSDKKVEIKQGDRLAVTGSRVTVGDSQVVLAREIRKGDTVWALRNAAGEPLWSTTQPEKRRFWTRTKVVLIVVGVKVALLATVLRH